MLAPHLHVPLSQVSEVCLEHLGPSPHKHFPLVQVSDNSVQSSSPTHTRILNIKIAFHIKATHIMTFSNYFSLYELLLRPTACPIVAGTR